MGQCRCSQKKIDPGGQIIINDRVHTSFEYEGPYQACGPLYRKDIADLQDSLSRVEEERARSERNLAEQVAGYSALVSAMDELFGLDTVNGCSEVEEAIDAYKSVYKRKVATLEADNADLTSRLEKMTEGLESISHSCHHHPALVCQGCKAAEILAADKGGGE